MWAISRSVCRVVLLVLAVFALAMSAAGASSGLEGRYCGTFQWNNDPEIQRVSFDFNQRIQTVDGFSLVHGDGVYITRRDGGTKRTRISVRMSVNDRTRAFEIIELNPDQSNFETNGSHQGRLNGAGDLVGTWTTVGTNQKGRLRLSKRACEALVS